ncbi:MAG: protein phosphatase 2C domain-containing protein [Deferrisomatales bacterium]|nr:protein phosphatase 2C domain-containing protein [Deferrisomatales bacterium]
MSHRCEAGFATETGSRRNNQDAVAVDPAEGYAVVADGMGGAPAGEVASRIAVTAVSEVLAGELPRPRSAEEHRFAVLWAIAEANRHIYEASRRAPHLRGMGTTVVILLLREGRFWTANVGDSRAYRLRDGSLTQLSRDHSLVQRRLEAGLITPEEARWQPDCNVLTRVLGTDPTVEPELREGEAAPGDVFVLTSDGVHGVLTDEAIRRAVAGRTPAAATRELVGRALAEGGRDNATAAVLRTV